MWQALLGTLFTPLKLSRKIEDVMLKEAVKVWIDPPAQYHRSGHKGSVVYEDGGDGLRAWITSASDYRLPNSQLRVPRPCRSPPRVIDSLYLPDVSERSREYSPLDYLVQLVVFPSFGAPPDDLRTANTGTEGGRQNRVPGSSKITCQHCLRSGVEYVDTWGVGIQCD